MGFFILHTSFSDWPGISWLRREPNRLHNRLQIKYLITRNIHSPRIHPLGRNPEWWKKAKARKTVLRAFERFDYYSGGDAGSRTISPIHWISINYAAPKFWVSEFASNYIHAKSTT